MAIQASNTSSSEARQNALFNTRPVRCLWRAQERENRKPGGRLVLIQFLCRSIFPVVHGEVFDTQLTSPMNLEPESFCCTPRISDTFIPAKALQSTTFPPCKRLLAKLPSAKCDSWCGR